MLELFLGHRQVIKDELPGCHERTMSQVEQSNKGKVIACSSPLPFYPNRDDKNVIALARLGGSDEKLAQQNRWKYNLGYMTSGGGGNFHTAIATMRCIGKTS